MTRDRRGTRGSGLEPAAQGARGGEPARGQQPRRGRPRWRTTIDSFGGFLTIGAVGGAILVVVLLMLRNSPRGASSDALLGEAVPIGAAEHVTDASLVRGRPGEPPVGGPHFAQPQAPGSYDRPVADGNVVHSLEHGLIWISYNPERLDAGGLRRLRGIAGDFRGDVVLSPRPENAAAIAVASWGRLLQLDAPDERQIRDFITTNRNRSPEPGVR